MGTGRDCLVALVRGSLGPIPSLQIHYRTICLIYPFYGIKGGGKELRASFPRSTVKAQLFPDEKPTRRVMVLGIVTFVESWKYSVVQVQI